jgi:hypothetical protein
MESAAHTSGDIDEPIVCVIDDGELLLIREMLGELGVRFGEGPPAENVPGGVNLLITNPKHALANERPPSKLHLVVYEGVSKTLRTALDRSGCDIALQSPLNPTVFQMIVERALYRGPERRAGARAVVAVDVQIKLGRRQLDATLGQLSVGGCSLVLGKSVEAGQQLKITLPEEVTGAAAIGLEGAVIHAGPVLSDHGAFDISVRFEKTSGVQQRALTKIVARYAIRERNLTATKPSVSEPQPAVESSAVGADRRKSERKVFTSRLLATAGGGSHLLLGCDLSIGGMRVRNDSGLHVGDRLKLALYARKGLPSVMLQALVGHQGSDGSFGLSFENLSDDVAAQLAQIVNSLPTLRAGPKSRPGVVVSEILEHLDSSD